MPRKADALAVVALALAAVGFQPCYAQSGAATADRNAHKTAPADSGSLDRMTVLRAAADALGMLRYSDIGSPDVHLPAVDAVNTMELWGSGTTYKTSKTGASEGPFQTEYRVALAYGPAAMRVEMTRTPSAGGQAAPGQLHSIEVVRSAYAWDESEIGAGLVPGKGTATPAFAAVKSRLLELWTLPYGVVKAALAAGDKTKISMENGATIITFPLSGQLAGVTVKATLDAKNEVAKVETQSDNPALREMLTETEYSDYADHGEILTDIKSPGHIIQQQGGHPVLDIRVKKVDANNPYLVFPVPENVKKAEAR